MLKWVAEIRRFNRKSIYLLEYVSELEDVCKIYTTGIKLVPVSEYDWNDIKDNDLMYSYGIQGEVEEVKKYDDIILINMIYNQIRFSLIILISEGGEEVKIFRLNRIEYLSYSLCEGQLKIDTDKYTMLYSCSELIVFKELKDIKIPIDRFEYNYLKQDALVFKYKDKYDIIDTLEGLGDLDVSNIPKSEIIEYHDIPTGLYEKYIEFKDFKNLLIGKRIVKWEGNKITIEGGLEVSIEETAQDCCARAYGEFKDVELDAAITDVKSIIYEPYEHNDGEHGCVATITIMHNRNKICIGTCDADAGNEGFYYSIGTFVIRFKGDEKYCHFVASFDGNN